jgi:hypothetical protein
VDWVIGLRSGRSWGLSPIGVLTEKQATLNSKRRSRLEPGEEPLAARGDKFTSEEVMEAPVSVELILIIVIVP